jgi:hypothetical protein
MMNPADMEKAKGVQLGLQQFEQWHLAVQVSDHWECLHCKVDFPCERMLMFMLIQSLAALSSMIPSGNMGSILNRFAGKG